MIDVESLWIPVKTKKGCLALQSPGFSCSFVKPLTYCQIRGTDEDHLLASTSATRFALSIFQTALEITFSIPFDLHVPFR